MVLSTRQEVALELAFSAGRLLGREEGRRGRAVETDRGLVTAMGEIEVGMIEREWASLERWTAYLVGGLRVEDAFDRGRLCEDCEALGWHIQPPEGL